jgi:hypothetical protein
LFLLASECDFGLLSIEQFNDLLIRDVADLMVVVDNLSVLIADAARFGA